MYTALYALGALITVALWVASLCWRPEIIGMRVVGACLYLLMVAVIGPPAVLVLTSLGIDTQDAFLAGLRSRSFIGAHAFFVIVLPWLVLVILYLLLSYASRSLFKFLALLVGRLALLYGTIPLALYSAIVLYGGFLVSVYWFKVTVPPLQEQIGRPLSLITFVLNNAVDIIIVALGTIAGVLVAAVPVVFAYQGTLLTHHLFRYYYPWHIYHRARRWPKSGYKAEVGFAETIHVILASDLHVTVEGEVTLEPEEAAKLIDPIRELKAVIAIHQPSAVVVTGDLTDLGSEPQWDRVIKGLPGPYQLITLAGNHDYHFRHIASRERFPMFHFPASFSSADIDKKLRKINGTNVEAPKLYRTAALDILALDSNRRPSGWPLTNAVGNIGKEQLAKARGLLSNRDRSRILIIALHHHVIPPEFTIDAPFLLCLDRDQVVDFALQYGAQAIVHGHTHQPFVYRHPAGLFIISCGSMRFNACGRFAQEVSTPSCYGLQLERGRIAAVKLLRVTNSEHGALT
jgi:predicted phosphodiesterase